MQPDDVIVVEDDAGLCEAMTRMLRASGYRATGYPSVEAMLAGVRPGEAACWVLDVHLPGRSGLRLVQEIPPSLRPPVVLISADDSAPLHRAASALGVPLMTKPFTGRELVAAVGRAGAEARRPADRAIRPRHPPRADNVDEEE